MLTQIQLDFYALYSFRVASKTSFEKLNQIVVLLLRSSPRKSTFCKGTAIVISATCKWDIRVVFGAAPRFPSVQNRLPIISQFPKTVA